MTTLGGSGNGSKDGILRNTHLGQQGFTSHAFSCPWPSLPITVHCDSDAHVAPLAAAYITTAFWGEDSGARACPFSEKTAISNTYSAYYMPNIVLHALCMLIVRSLRLSMRQGDTTVSILRMRI